MEKYQLASHNSWTYLPPKKWWMGPLRFTAMCQRVDICEQYQLGVRCFDLRIKFGKDGRLQVAHGLMVYDIFEYELLAQLRWMNYHGDCFVRVVHEVRRESEYTEEAVRLFKKWCHHVESEYDRVGFWNGRNVYDHAVDYHFKLSTTCEELYASVREPRIIDDWWPWWYAWIHNGKNIKKGTDKQFLMIDFVDMQ